MDESLSERVMGQIAYDAYSYSTGGRSVNTGLPLPPWDRLSEDQKQVWVVAAPDVLKALRVGIN